MLVATEMCKSEFFKHDESVKFGGNFPGIPNTCFNDVKDIVLADILV